VTSIYNDLDDVGQENGRIEIPFAWKARDRVCSYPVAAVGRRPKDYAQRDLLIGGWQKDGRCFRFRQLIKNMDPRFYVNTRNLRRADRDICARARAFQFMHTATLLGFANDLVGDERACRTLDSLLRCPPTLFAIEADALKRSGHQTCKRIRLCPYCLSRKAVDLYDRLKVDYRRGTRKCLALLSVFIPIDAPCVSASTEKVRERFKTDSRENLGRLFELVTEHLGSSGGLIVSDVGPNLTAQAQWNDGEIEIENSQELELHLAILSEVSENHFRDLANSLSLPEPLLTPFRQGEIAIEPTVTIRHCGPGDALRSLLFGEAPSKLRGENVVDGAFRFPPWHLASQYQWRQYLHATRGAQTFRFWGDWKERYATSREPPVQTNQFTNAPQRRGSYKRRLNLQRANRARQLEKDNALDELLPHVRNLWEQLCIELGKDPGHTRLRRHATAAGIILTERQAREFVNRLSSNC